MADANHGDATLCLHHYGYIAASDPTSRHVEEPARADIKALRANSGVCIEVKDGKDEGGHAFFDLSEWRDNQREWAVKFCEAPPYSTRYWIWLRIGLGVRNKLEPTKTWLLPRKKLAAICALVQPIQNRLVYQVRPGLSIELQERKLDALTLLGGFELQWNPANKIRKPDWMLARFPDSSPVYTQGIYTIPQNHPFYRKHIQPRRTLRPLWQKVQPYYGDVAYSVS